MKNTILTAHLFLLFSFILCSVSTIQAQELKTGYWTGQLKIQQSHHIRFAFEVDEQQNITLHNGEERIKMNRLKFENDSIKVYFSSFPNYLIFQVDTLKRPKLNGYFVNPDRVHHKRIAFHARFSDNESSIFQQPPKAQNITGKWQVIFSPNASDEYPAIGKFKQNHNDVTGTFLTETGDYRFLNGVMYKNNLLQLTCFDGAHVFLFTAQLENDTLKGKFFSGNHRKTDWIGVRNKNFQLKNPYSITYMINKNFSFRFPKPDGEEYHFPNKETQGKVVIVQILGTWCPNCLDETNYYKKLYKKYNDKGLKIIGVAYEDPKTFKEQADRVKRYIHTQKIDYTILVGGKASKETSAKDFDMLNDITSFPTSIFINRQGEVVKIHTGFNGPGTGEIYTEYKKETDQLIQRLLNE